MSGGILGKIINIQFHKTSFSFSPVVTFRRTDRKGKRNKNIIYLVFIPELTEKVKQ